MRIKACFLLRTLTVTDPSDWAEQREKNVKSITRRNFLQATAAGLAAAPAFGRSAFAGEPLKVGFIFLGPIGD